VSGKTSKESHRRYNESAKGRARTIRYKVIRGYLQRRERALGAQRERVVAELAKLEGKQNAEGK
jgi:hypothetical protein